MEINKELLTKKDWETLEETADTIIKNATRDLILWSEVKNNITRIKEKNEEN